MTFVLNPSLYKPLPASDAEAQRLTSARERILSRQRAGEQPDPADVAIAQPYQYASVAERDAARRGEAPSAPASPTPAASQTPPAATSGQSGEVAGRVQDIADGAGNTLGRFAGTSTAAADTGIRTVVDAITNPGETAAATGEAVSTATNNFFNNLNPGNITGGLIGAAGAFMVSNMFGSGPIKWVLMALLMPAAILLGAGQLGGGINNFFSGLFGRRNRDNNQQGQEREQAQGQQQTQGQGQQQAGAEQSQTPQPNILRIERERGKPWYPVYDVLNEMQLEVLPDGSLRGATNLQTAGTAVGTVPTPAAAAQSVTQQVYDEGRRQMTAGTTAASNTLPPPPPPPPSSRPPVSRVAGA